MPSKVAVITGFGFGLGEQLALKLTSQGYKVIGLSRNLINTNNENIVSVECDVSDSSKVSRVFDEIRQRYSDPDLLIHNAAPLLLEDFLKIRSEDFERLWRTTSLGAFLVTQEVLPAMLQKKQGTLLYTGATASVKAGPESAAFASAKFALRGFAQSLARAYNPQGIHVVHTIIDGVIWGDRAENQFKMALEDCMKAEEVADSYMGLIEQKSSCWTHEIDMRPHQESF